MGNLAVWLIGMVMPVVKKALVGLGFGIITYAATTTLLNSVKDQVVSNFGALSGSVAQIIALFGFGTAIGIILGAFAARLALVAVKKLGLLSD